MFKLTTTVASGMLLAVLLAPHPALSESPPTEAAVGSAEHQAAHSLDTAVHIELTTRSASMPTNAEGRLAYPGWARVTMAATLWTDATRAARGAALPVGALVEIVGGGTGGTVLVRYPGDGQERPPGRGWIDQGAVHQSDPPTAVPSAYPATTDAGVIRVQVPYRSQRDGSPWAESNCGPTSLGMALAAFGVNLSSSELRVQTLDAQAMWGDDAGTLLDALAQVARNDGVATVGVSAGGEVKRWSVGEIREQLLQKRPMIIQVRFQALPGRAHSLYAGDHYIVLTGLVGESILYNDPFDSDGLGFDRLMSATTLQDAMRTSDGRYAAAAFALARR